jgi:hypothetical protein
MVPVTNKLTLKLLRGPVSGEASVIFEFRLT